MGQIVQFEMLGRHKKPTLDPIGCSVTLYSKESVELKTGVSTEIPTGVTVNEPARGRFFLSGLPENFLKGLVVFSGFFEITPGEEIKVPVLLLNDNSTLKINVPVAKLTLHDLGLVTLQELQRIRPAQQEAEAVAEPK